MREIGYLQELYQDARSTKLKVVLSLRTTLTADLLGFPKTKFVFEVFRKMTITRIRWSHSNTPSR